MPGAAPLSLRSYAVHFSSPGPYCSFMAIVSLGPLYWCDLALVHQNLRGESALYVFRGQIFSLCVGCGPRCVGKIVRGSEHAHCFSNKWRGPKSRYFCFTRSHPPTHTHTGTKVEPNHVKKLHRTGHGVAFGHRITAIGAFLPVSRLEIRTQPPLFTQGSAGQGTAIQIGGAVIKTRTNQV
jgi:hypothetical protein